MRHSAKMLVCSTQRFSRSHPRKHPADPPEHLERSVGLRPSGGRPTRSRACFVITDGAEGVNVVSTNFTLQCVIIVQKVAPPLCGGNDQRRIIVAVSRHSRIKSILNLSKKEFDMFCCRYTYFHSLMSKSMVFLV